MSWRVVLNGKVAEREDVREAIHAVREQGIDVSVRVTWEHGDGARYVAEAVRDCVTTIVAGGGDGTLNELCAALATQGTGAAALPSIGILPLGTANDFASACGVSDEPRAALATIASEAPRTIDLLRVKGDDRLRWCVNLATAGFGTQITAETDPGLKKLLGGAAYLLTGLTRFSSIGAAHAVLRGPQFDWDGEFLVLALANGRQAGGGHVLAPDALLDDGMLDLTLLPPPPDGEMTGFLGSLLTQGRAALIDAAVRTRLPWVEIRSEAAMTINLDGEPMQAQNVRIEVVKAALRMHLPRASRLLASNAPPGAGILRRSNPAAAGTPQDPV